MKKLNVTKKVKILIAGFAVLCSGMLYPQLRHEADNCAYTANSADYCYASNGTNNLKVINCSPGSTSCYY
tara:strand:- start:9176 stop:9385 length:210 start_codon:yes stop_codon:yes gene_type:complete